MPALLFLPCHEAALLAVDLLQCSWPWKLEQERTSGALPPLQMAHRFWGLCKSVDVWLFLVRLRGEHCLSTMGVNKGSTEGNLAGTDPRLQLGNIEL